MKKKLRYGVLISVILLCVLWVGWGYAQEKGRYIHVEIAPVMMDREGIITIVSDDGFYDTGVNLNELAGKHGLKLTIAGVVDIINPYLDEWLAIEKEGNLELISHSWSHLKMSEESNYSDEELKHQITDSINYYKDKFSTDQIAFIAPENTLCEKGYDFLKENGIYSVRQGVRGNNSFSPLEGHYPAQWYRLLTYGIGDNDTTEWRNSLIDSAINDKCWLIEMWYNVYKEGQDIGYQGISYEMADEHMAYLSEKVEVGEVWNASLVDATKYLYEKEYASVEAVQKGNIITIKLKTDTTKLPEDIFDYPLTVKIPLPETWDENKVTSKEKGIEVVIKEKNKVKYILFEMIPNSKEIIIENVQ